MYNSFFNEPSLDEQFGVWWPGLGIFACRLCGIEEYHRTTYLSTTRNGTEGLYSNFESTCILLAEIEEKT